jgi:hypothetical protein
MTVVPFVDPGALREVAHRLASHAGQLRAHAGALRMASAQAHWHSTGATAFRERGADICLALDRAAGELDDAAAAMARHADRVGDVLDAARRVAEHAAHEAASAGRRAFGDVEHAGAAVLHAVGL